MHILYIDTGQLVDYRLHKSDITEFLISLVLTFVGPNSLHNENKENLGLLLYHSLFMMVKIFVLRFVCLQNCSVHDFSCK